ncbi:hypothetical protein [Rhodopseudomonas telluris]|uniref:Tail fiber protein n=1 Tax=Rhodopseudomonas telluris TaxID=644215 RepID=A0ABV6EZN5_9BRAD
MARKHFDNVRHLITTTGTGEITLGTVPATWRSFAAAGAVAGDQPGYTIQDGDGIELGYLTLGAGALTAARTVIYSSNSNNPLDLSGSAILECTPLASMINDDLVSFVRAQSASSGEKAQARSNLGMTTTGQALATAMNAADARDTIGATSVGSALLTAADAAAARTAAGATTVGSSLFTAANAGAARTAIGLRSGGASVKNADYKVVASDYEGLLVLSGAHTLTFDPATTLGAVFRVFINNGASAWTFTAPSGSQINGAASMYFPPRSSAEILCDGTNFWVIGGSLAFYGTYTPTVFSLTGSYAAASASGFYQVIGNLVTVAVYVVITSNGSAGTATYCSLPIAPAVGTTGCGREVAATGWGLSVSVDSQMLLQRYDGGYAGASGYTFRATASYFI